MKYAKPLPSYLSKRYAGWRATQFQENKAWYARLADEGQRPRAMIISCCDSRVHVTAIFGAETGEFFIHRNIANLVPPFKSDSEPHGTSSAIEYAVKYLHVANLLVVGHSDCGGVGGCLDMCSGDAPHLEDGSSFIGRWMDILRPGYERIKDLDVSKDEKQTALEKQGVIISMENLMSFPFVQEAVESGDLALHGLWNDIRDGSLEVYNGEEGIFEKI